MGIDDTAIIGGTVVGCMFLVGSAIIIYCFCKEKARRRQGQTITTAAYDDYVLNPMTYGVQSGQVPHDQQSYPAQPPLQTGHMAMGTCVFNNPEMQGPPSYEHCFGNQNNLF